VPRAIGAAVMMLIVISGCGALAYSLQGQEQRDSMPRDSDNLHVKLFRAEQDERHYRINLVELPIGKHHFHW
jgi:hypothetical protein